MSKSLVGVYRAWLFVWLPLKNTKTHWRSIVFRWMRTFCCRTEMVKTAEEDVVGRGRREEEREEGGKRTERER